MRWLKPAVGAGVMSLGVLVSVPVAAVDTVVLPFAVAPGALVEVNVTSCPVPATATAVAEVGPEGGSVTEEASAPAGEGAATLVVQIPTDAVVGTWTATASCLDADGGVVDGPVTAEFTVANFPLLTIEPRTGPAGTTITVSGAGCPTGVSDSVFVRVAGASDDPIPAFDPTTPGTPVELAAGGSFTGSLTVPAESPEGENLVWAYCVSEGGSAVGGPIAGTFVVSNSLPPTGAPWMVIALAAAGALVVGLALSAVPARPAPGSARER